MLHPTWSNIKSLMLSSYSQCEGPEIERKQIPKLNDNLRGNTYNIHIAAFEYISITIHTQMRILHNSND